MKTKTIIIIFLSILIPLQILSQEYRMTLSDSREYVLKLNQIEAHITIEGHQGNEIIITAVSLPEVPEKAKGLRPLTKSGVDNTSIGLNMEIIDNLIAFTGGKTGDNLKYQFKIPKNVSLFINNRDFDKSYDLTIKNISKEIEVTISCGDIVMENITGPVIARSDRGNIDIVFGKVCQESPISVICQEGDIDVTISGDEAVTFKLSAGEGDIFTDLDIKEEEDASNLTGFNGKIPKSGIYSYRFDYAHPSPRIEFFIDPNNGLIEKFKKYDNIPSEPEFKEFRGDDFFEELENGKKKYSDAMRIYTKALALSQPFYFYDFFFYDFKGRLNDGGVEIAIKTENGNIYLRKAK